MTIFSAQSLLSPEVMFRQIENALGYRIFTTLSRLDPTVVLRQIENATGASFPLMALYDPVLALREIDEAILSGGGEGAPEWLPDGAIAHVDFTTTPVRAYAGGQEVSDLTTIFGNSALIPITYDPESIVPGTGLTDSLAVVGALRTALLSDFTMLAEFDGQCSFEMAETAFMTDVVFGCSVDEAGTRISDQTTGLYAPDMAGFPDASKMAVTILINESAYGSVDHVRLEQDGDGPTLIDFSMPNTVTDIILFAAADWPLERLTIYSPVKTEAETQALTA